MFGPTGQKELDPVAASGWLRWPPRLINQPIFYPVTTFTYAEKIARDWNSVAAAPNNRGFAPHFEINAARAAQYPVQLAGGRAHEKLWVPAEELEDVNDGIIGLKDCFACCRDGKRIDEPFPGARVPVNPPPS